MAKLDYFWRKAAEYTQRAEETTDEEVRIFFYRLRDAWIAAANRNEMLEALDMPVPTPSSPEETARASGAGPSRVPRDHEQNDCEHSSRNAVLGVYARAARFKAWKESG